MTKKLVEFCASQLPLTVNFCFFVILQLPVDFFSKLSLLCTNRYLKTIISTYRFRTFVRKPLFDEHLFENTYSKGHLSEWTFILMNISSNGLLFDKIFVRTTFVRLHIGYWVFGLVIGRFFQ